MVRYFVPFIAFLCIGQARGLYYVVNRFFGDKSDPPLKWIGGALIAALIMAGVFFQSSPAMFFGAPQSETWVKTLYWLKARVPPDTVFMSDRPAMAFQADLKWIVTPRGLEPGGFMAFVREKGVRYIMFDAWRKETPPTNSSGNLVEGLTIVFRAGDSNRDELLVVEVTPENTGK